METFLKVASLVISGLGLLLKAYEIILKKREQRKKEALKKQPRRRK